MDIAEAERCYGLLMKGNDPSAALIAIFGRLIAPYRGALSGEWCGIQTAQGSDAARRCSAHNRRFATRVCSRQSLRRSAIISNGESKQRLFPKTFTVEIMSYTPIGS
jgi:hypothetical protein